MKRNDSRGNRTYRVVASRPLLKARVVAKPQCRS